jgi:hypothetical protein
MNQSEKDEIWRIVNEEPLEDWMLEELYGFVLTEFELYQQYKVLEFDPPFVTVQRKADGLMVRFLYQEAPRFYFGFRTI